MSQRSDYDGDVVLMGGDAMADGQDERPRPPIPVVVTDVNISFGNLVGLILKVLIALIPVAVILAVAGLALFALIRGTLLSRY